MKIPSWREFDKKTSNLEKEIDKNIQSFKNNHPLLDRALKQSFSILPSPFNNIAGKIYDTLDGSEEDKSSGVLTYLSYIKNQGESYYYNESSQYYDYTKILYAQQSFNTGNNYLSVGDYNTAIMFYDLALKNAPFNPLIWYNKGLAMHNMGKNEEAIKYYRQALSINP